MGAIIIIIIIIWLILLAHVSLLPPEPLTISQTTK